MSKSPKPTLPNGQSPLLFYASGFKYFAEGLASLLGLEAIPIINKKFSNGEDYYRIPLENNLDLVGRDVLLVCTTATDADLLFVIRVGCQLATLGTRRRVFVCPFFGYSTMERASLPGEVVTTKVNCRLLSTIPCLGLGNVFLFLDLHVQTIQYFVEDCIAIELYAESVLRSAIEEMNLPNSSVIFGSSDLGRPKWLQSYARYFNTSMAFINKMRSFESVKVLHVIGDVAGRVVIIYDDMVRSGGTLIAACEAYLEAGATKVYAVVSHLALSTPEVATLIEESKLELVISTDSHPMSQLELVQKSKKFRIVSCASVFCSAVERLMNH
ncbi:hypothetical protein RCL1_003641 [Eukaryota sp. TZLM3-RCL]